MSGIVEIGRELVAAVKARVGHRLRSLVERLIAFAVKKLNLKMKSSE